MRVAIYARVSTEAQEARGTIGSQVAALHERVAAEGHEVVSEFLDDGHSGARLDRPGLDSLRDAAEAGLLDAVWCLSPDRLARVYAYQVIVLEEFARLGVAVFFADAPKIDDDPQARLLTQVQGVIAEYERAKIAERYRRGKLWALVRERSSRGRRPTGIGGRPARLIEPRTSRCSSPRRKWCEGSSTTTSPAGTPRARSPAVSTPTGYRRPRARRCGGRPPSGGCSATRPTWAGCISTRLSPCPTRDPDAPAARCPGPDKTG